MAGTGHFPVAEVAAAYRARHDARVKALSRLGATTLRELEGAQLAAQGVQRVAGGPASRDELVGAIVDAEFPRALMDEASHVLYHKPGETWGACQWCQPRVSTARPTWSIAPTVTDARQKGASMSSYVVVLTAVDGTVSAAGPFLDEHAADHFAGQVAELSDLEPCVRLIEPPRRVLGGLRWLERATETPR
jgi:hypothetical protein